MNRTLLKSKIHRATVTEANIEYEGSVTIDPILLDAADMLPYEQVDIWNCTNGNRLTTYIIEGERGEGQRKRLRQQLDQSLAIAEKTQARMRDIDDVGLTE